MQRPTLTPRVENASERVVETVAAREGVDPSSLDVPLFAVVDPDALDALVHHASDRPGRSSVRVGFSYCGYDVEVGSGGSVDVFETS